MGIVCAIGLLISAILLILQKRHFHFSAHKESIAIIWGGLSIKKAAIPFSTITDVVIARSFLDKLFGIASLKIIVKRDTHWAASYMLKVRRWDLANFLGFVGNVVNIPGLSQRDAETLKASLGHARNEKTPLSRDLFITQG